MEEGQLEASSLPPKSLYSEVTLSVTGTPPSAVKEEETAKETDTEIIPEKIEPLSILDVLRVSTVLEDTIGQLSVLNYIMPVQYERRQNTSVKKNNEMNLEEKSLVEPLEVSRTLKSAVLPQEQHKLPEIRQGGQFANKFDKMQDLILSKPARQTVMTTETLKKIQMDRQFLSDVITDTMQELQNSGTFTTLLKSLSEERENKMHFYDIIAREENGRKQIKYLQKQLLNVKKEWQAEVENQNTYIARLKDQLQELKAKTDMENHYMKRNTELQISQTQKKCNKTEELLLEEIEKLRLKIEEENQIHTQIEVFLRREQQVREYEQVITEDRIEKEKIKRKVEQSTLELKSIIKLQAWWRGTMVRNEIGGFKMPKPDKEDKDSKGKQKGKRRGKKQ
ncbi:dynein regulatory complex protein 9 isoform X3 [Saccopteryx bilineata]|uniref:dynein regulatory complex protein 9 isoform X3 n=1 Tax=Saccopteryx bilineata TaxID=59482 RepID=UPI00338FF776